MCGSEQHLNLRRESVMCGLGRHTLELQFKGGITYIHILRYGRKLNR